MERRTICQITKKECLFGCNNLFEAYIKVQKAIAIRNIGNTAAQLIPEAKNLPIEVRESFVYSIAAISEKYKIDPRVLAVFVNNIAS